LGLTENELIKERDGIGTSQSSLELNSDTIYFLQVVTMDSEGNQSYSEIFQFRTL
jgi:outer membrane lipoprotein-sorting protein